MLENSSTVSYNHHITMPNFIVMANRLTTTRMLHCPNWGHLPSHYYSFGSEDTSPHHAQHVKGSLVQTRMTSQNNFHPTPQAYEMARVYAKKACTPYKLSAFQSNPCIEATLLDCCISNTHRSLLVHLNPIVLVDNKLAEESTPLSSCSATIFIVEIRKFR